VGTRRELTDCRWDWRKCKATGKKQRGAHCKKHDIFRRFFAFYKRPPLRSESRIIMSCTALKTTFMFSESVAHVTCV
jgi:hypothetical protein